MDTAGFFLITFVFTFALQLPAALARLGVLPGDPAAYLPLATFGIFGPLVAATWLTQRERGRAGVRALFGGLVDFRVPMRWALAALFVPASLLSLGLWSMRAAGYQGAWHYLPSIPQLVVALVVSVAEETGWRGYALPRLIEKYGPFLGSSILGVLWALWHIPMFLAVGIPMSLGLVLLLFFVGGSLYFTFLYRKAQGSLLIAVLAHVGAHLNNSHAALPADTLPLLVHTVVYAALGFITMRGTAFERRFQPSPQRASA
jgi:membrane protease YdiL (CAAX protease family)